MGCVHRNKATVGHAVVSQVEYVISDQSFEEVLLGDKPYSYVTMQEIMIVEANSLLL